MCGEKLVYKFEEKKLKESKDSRLRERNVEHTSIENGDGDGYDILSYSIDATTNDIIPKYIEVKTTVGDIDTPFYISENEYEKMRSLKNYVIYRVFDCNSDDPKYDEIPIELIMENAVPSNYKVKLSKE